MLLKAFKISFILGFCICFIQADTGHDDDDDDGQPNYCPKVNGMFPNPTDCATFYNCVDGTAIPMSCAPGLLFDPHTKMCNFPNQVKCSNECRGPNGLFPSQHRCDEFILCTDNKPKIQRCKKGLYFDPNLQVCNYKSQVVCNLPGKKGNKTSGGYIPTKECPRPSGVFPNASNCSTFYLCTDGVHHLQNCPGGLHYDPKRVRCNFPLAAQCQAERRNSLTKTKPEVSSKPRKSRLCPQSDGIFRNAANCSTFLFCVDGRSFVQECPPGLVFDPQRVKCDKPQVVGCLPPPSTLSVLKCPELDGVFRHPTDCGTFYLCKRGRFYQYHCPQDLVFDYRKQRCDYQRNVQCPEHFLERRKHQKHYMAVQKINRSDYFTRKK